MLPLITISLFLVSSLLLYNYIIYPLFISPLSKIPTLHPTSRFSSYFITRHKKQQRSGVKILLEAHKKHGSVVLISPTDVSINSVSSLRQVYNSGAWEKTPWYTSFDNYQISNLVSTVGNRAHSFQKRMISNVYSKSFIQSSTDLDVLSRILIFERLLPILEKAVRNDGGRIDAYGINVALGADFIDAFLFGIQNGTDFLQDTKARDRFMVDFKIKFGGLPGEEESGKVVEDFVLRMCEKANSEPTSSLSHEEDTHSTRSTNPVVYVQLLARLKRDTPVSASKPQHQLTAASEMMDQLAASIETTRVALTYVQWELSQQPQLMKALQSELATLSPPLLSALPSTTALPALPDPKTIDSLPILNSILKETLRVYTPSPIPFPRQSPSEGAVVDGFFIPGGMSVAASAYCLHRTESVYEHAEAWKPERWLGNPGGGVDGGKGERSEMERWFWAFGSGGRMCIGSHYAVQMLKLCIAALYANYSTTILDDEGIEPEEAFIAAPKGETLVLRLHPISGSS